MSAPTGNKFWEKRSSHGRNPIFSNPDDLWKAACEYFEWVEQTPLFESKPFAYQGVVVQEPVAKMRAMTIDGLCLFLDVDRKTWQNYRARDDFFPIVERIEKVIWQQKFAGAAAELLNSNIIMRELGLGDKVQQELSGPNGGPIQSTINAAGLSSAALAEILALRDATDQG